MSFVLGIFLLSCSGTSGNELAVIKALDESLINSNRDISRRNEILYQLVQTKLTDPATSIKAKYLQPKVIIVKELSSSLAGYIENLRNELKKQAGLTINKGKESFDVNDRKAVVQLFVKDEKGKELYDRLKQYKNEVLAIDSQIATIFKEIILLTTQSFDSLNESKKNFTKTFFSNIPVMGALSILSLLENNSKITENRLLTFLDDKMTSHSFEESYTTFSAIVAQSTSVVRGGEAIEITAGIGAFSRAAKPAITFNRSEISINEYGAAVYKFKTPLKVGKYIVPVEISYIDQDGRRRHITKDVEYTVVKEL